MFELVQHTADVRIRVAAPSVEELFRDALRGLTHFISAGAPLAAAEKNIERIQVDSVDQSALLVDFLNEALLRCHLRKLLFIDASFDVLTDTMVVAGLTGVAASEMAEDVKAVTYHEADVRQDEGVWTTTIVLDI